MTRGLSIDRRLMWFVLAVATPMLLLSVAIVWRLADRERDISRQAIMYSSHSISSAVDALLGKYMAVSQALAASPSLAAHNLVAFREEAERALPGLSGAWVVLTDQRGQQLVNTLIPAGQPLPLSALEVRTAENRALETRHPQVSDEHIGPVARIPVVTVVTPELSRSDAMYFVIIVVDTAVFRGLLNGPGSPQGWRAAVIDRSGNVIARSRDHELWVGRPAGAGWQSVRQRDGVFELPSFDGEPLIHANTISGLSGWAIGVASERRELEAPIRQTIFIAGVAGLLVIALSILIAVWAARSIAVPIRALETGAEALRHHQPVSFRATGVPEVDHALQAFETASRELSAHEARRSEVEIALKTSVEQLRLFIEQAPASIAMFDRDMRYLAVSHRWLARFGPDRQDVIGRSHYEVLPEIPPQWKERHRRALDGEVQAADDDAFVRTDGRTQWVSWEIRPWHAPDGTIGGIVIFADDVTFQHEAVTALNENQARLLQTSRLSEIGQMAAALAHELNQPLTAVASYIGGCRRLLGFDDVDKGRKRKLLDVLERANVQTLRAGEIIRRLREFIGSGQAERTLEDAADVMREACTLAIAAAKHNGVSIRSDIDNDGQILVDKVQIQQVIVNLARNAVEAMETTPRKELAFALSVTDDRIEFSVSDTGSGLSPDMTGRLFKPFSSTKAHGMGIGLSVCRKIVEAHDGKIWAETNPGGGTVFRFTLPLVGDETGAQEQVSRAAHLRALS